VLTFCKSSTSAPGALVLCQMQAQGTSLCWQIEAQAPVFISFIQESTAGTSDTLKE